MEEKSINEKRELRFVPFITSLSVLFRVPIDTEVYSRCFVFFLIEANDVDRDASPTAMDMKTTVMVVDEPFVIHVFRNVSLFDESQLFLSL